MIPILILPLLMSQAGTETVPVAIPIPPIQIRTVPPPPPPPPRLSVSAKPRGNPGSWVTTDDYPSRALRHEQEGRVNFRLIVGADGRTTHCEIRESSGWPVLDQATCQLIQRRARFTPATDGHGTPVEGSYSSAVRWIIPDDGGYEVLPNLAATGRSFVIEADGTITDCRTGIDAFVPEGAAIPCNTAEFMIPYRDSVGKPVRRKVTIMTETSIADAP